MNQKANIGMAIGGAIVVIILLVLLGKHFMTPPTLDPNAPNEMPAYVKARTSGGGGAAPAAGGDTAGGGGPPAPYSATNHPGGNAGPASHRPGYAGQGGYGGQGGQRGYGHP